jgi:cobyrinic acid a,c-diamide synthase
MITRQELAQKLTDYLQHRIALAELVDWAERALMEDDLDERDLEVLRESLARLGLADVKAFGLSWEECEQLLARLGYRIQVQVSPVT